MQARTRPFLLVLNQSFDPNWAAYVEPTSASQPFWWTWTHPAVLHKYHIPVNGYANGWLIDRPGTYRIVVEYWPQRLTDIGIVVLWLTVLGCVVAVFSPVIVAWTHRRKDSIHAGRTAWGAMRIDGHGRSSELQGNNNVERRSAR